MVRELIELNMTRMAASFGVLTTIWRKWETAQSIPDAGVMIAFCDRYFVTVDWLYRGRLSGLQEDLIAKLCGAYPELLDRKPVPPTPSPALLPAQTGPRALPPLSVPEKPATGYRPRKPRSKKSIDRRK